MTASALSPPGSRTGAGMAWIPAGSFLMGSEDFYPEERPVRRVEVKGFWIDERPVTVTDFRRFVNATGYVTVAERPLDPADYPDADPDALVPGALVFRRARGPVDLRDFRQWWTYVPGASWKRPEGAVSDTYTRARHPVTQVAFEDAEAYAAWAGKALPTEAEWEYAARGGLEAAAYAWGDEGFPGGTAMANTWQGEFPWQNLRIDGYEGTSPVGAFPPNGHGLYDMTGNVWEWTCDLFAAAAAASPCCAPDRGGDIPRRVIKGGSHLCAPNYCLRYRPAARQGEAIDTSTGHIGFRCVVGSSTQALGVTLDGWIGARPLFGAHVSARAAQRAVAVAIVPMVALTVWLALASEHLERPVASALYWSYLTAAPMLIGLVWWVRRPASRFGPLLVAFGILAWVVSWQSSDWPLAFNVGVLFEGPAFLLTFYLFLAFPMGRLEPAAARWLMAALVFAVAGFFVPWALFSPVIAGGGPLTRCAPNCPENVLQVGSAPGLVEVAGKAETYSALAITVAVLIVYVLRLRAASPPQRRALTAVAVTSLLFLPAYFVFNFSAWILHLDQATLDTLAWGIVGTRVLLPLGFLIALLQAQEFATRALQNILEHLAARPTPAQWRETIATALDDPALRLGYYDPDTKRFRDSDGEEVTRPPEGAGRAWVPVDRGGRAVAVMVIDETLAEDPELVRAAASATLLAVENGDLEGELRASRARILEAGHAERRRIERDLHDSAQQRLVSLRIDLTIAGERFDGSEERAMLERLGGQVDDAIEELRDVAHGIYPAVLADRGVGTALKAVARSSAIPVRVGDEWRGRHSEAVETTVYLCCLECLQNAAKHAGRGVSATVCLRQADGHVGFSVEDDGTGFDPGVVERGAGLTNLADRVAAVGGTLEIDARPGRGTRVSGEIPAQT